MYIRSEYNEKDGDEVDVGCLLIFDEANKSVIDSFALNNGRNYICGTINSVFEPYVKRNINQIKESNSHHAIIHYEQGEFFIEDNGGEIGTFRKNLNFRIKPFCKYEIKAGEVIYFGKIKTKLIKYDDTSENIETPKWKYKKIDLDDINEEKIIEKLSCDRISTKSDDSNEYIDEIRPKENIKLKSSEKTFNISENKENDNSLNNLKKKSPVKSDIHISNTESNKKIILLWTGCSPTNKDLELIKRSNISFIDNEDLEFMSNKITHVISSSIKRTLKFLWAVSKGLPIISPNTLRKILSSNKTKNINFEEFNKICMTELLSDPEGEKKFGFSLKDSIYKSQNNSIFTGYKFIISPSIKVLSKNEINWLITSGDAEIITTEQINKVKDKNKLIIIGTNADTKLFK